MWIELTAWLKDNLPLLTAFGSLVAYLLYDRKRNALEREKLELELKKLKSESLIYRPTFQEIRAIQQDTQFIATKKLKAFGPEDRLEQFGIALHSFLIRLLAYYGDSEAGAQIAAARLQALAHHLPDSYGKDFNPGDFPDPKPILRDWSEVRASAFSQLSQDSIKRIDALLERFSSATKAAKKVATPFSNERLADAVAAGNPETVRYLIEEECADPNARGGSHDYPLLISALLKGHQAIVHILLQAGANPDSRGGQKKTALIIAAERGYRAAVRKLIDSGAAINLIDQNGMSALIRAARAGHNEIVEMLLDAGADWELRDDNGRTAFDHATKRGFREVVETLRALTRPHTNQLDRSDTKRD